MAFQARLLNTCLWYQNRACRQHTLVLAMQESVVVINSLFYMFTLNQSLEGWRMLGEGYAFTD